MRLFLCIACLFFCSLIQAQPVTAKSWLVADANGKIIKGENTTAMRPVASISKLITVMIVLDAKQDLDEKLTFRTFKSKQKRHKKEKVTETEQRLTRRQLIDMALVHSDNHATNILCNNYGSGTPDCISAMNFKVAHLGMMHTTMMDPTGLDNRNISTAEDLILLVQAARHYPVIVNASKQSKIEIKVSKRYWVFNNTNPMIGKDRRIVVSKTGFTNPAGGCIVLGLDTELGQRTIVVLGSKNTRTRIPEAEFISNIKQGD
jgi:D-alanyl-D-alanine endopeptidase (penicillin-binding protein 7)